MNQLLVGPLLVLFLSSFALELSDIAQHTREQILTYSTQMDAALPCAFAGIPVERCSPDLFAYKPEQDLVALNETLTAAMYHAAQI